MQTVSDIIELWPRTKDFADGCGVEYMTAHQWRRRNKIPPEYWAAIVRSAKERRLPVTEKLLAEVHDAKKRSEQRTSKKRRSAHAGVAA